MDFAPVAGIVTLCLLLGRLIKESPIDQRWIPHICAILGGIFGVLGMLFVPDFPADNYIDAIILGVSSGLSSTGAHQAVKQVTVGD